MKDHSGCQREFIWSTRAWHKLEDGPTDIIFGMYDDEGGTSGEMTMRWVYLNGSHVPMLEAFNDSWSALSLFCDLLQKMGEVDDEPITQERFVEILLSCGFKDKTEYKSPYQETP